MAQGPSSVTDMSLEMDQEHVERVTLKQANERVTPRTTVQPERNRCILGIVASFEEPKESVGCWGSIHVTGIRLDARRCLADSFFPGLFVADGSIVGSFDGLDTTRVVRHLFTNEAGLAGYSQGQQQGDPTGDVHDESIEKNRL